MTDDSEWTLCDTAYLSRGDRVDSVEFAGHTGDWLGEETSGAYAVFRDGERLMIVQQEDVDP